MDEDTVIIIVVVAIALIVLVWLLYFAAGLVLVFTVFVMELPIVLTILMFIIFPPTLFVFLVGLAFIRFGIADALAASTSDRSTDTDTPKLNKRDIEKERKKRKALGYDE